MSRVSRQIAFLSDNIDIAVEYILLNRYIGGQSTEYSHAGLSGPVGALPGFADIKLKLLGFIPIVFFKRLGPENTSGPGGDIHSTAIPTDIRICDGSP